MEAQKTGNKNQGRQVKRFRESIGMKQATLAEALGTTQQNISNYEKQEELDGSLFAQLAVAMGVAPEILSDFNPESIYGNHIQEMKDNAQAVYCADSSSYTYNFNPIDKIMEQVDQIKALYEELLKCERDKIDILKGIINRDNGKTP